MDQKSIEHMYKIASGINPNAMQEYSSGVYDVKKTLDSNKNPTYELVKSEEVKDRFVTPTEVFGDIMKYIKRIWNSFAISKSNTGVMFIGNSGSGKTDATNILSNIALNNNLYIVNVINIEADLGLIRFLNTLNNCVINFEEFSKNFSWNIQEKMLTMFSNSNCKRLYIINDNDKRNISNFILDRPGRIKYKKEFNKLDEDVFKYYLEKQGISKDTEFYSDMLNMYKTTTILSMDHVKHIIEEHRSYPEDTLKDIINILNVGVLQKDITYDIFEIKVKDKDEYYKVTRANKIIKSDFDNGRNYYLNLELIEQPVSPETNEQPQQPIRRMGGNGIHGLKLDNSNVIDSNKVLTTVEVDHNGTKFIVKMMIEE